MFTLFLLGSLLIALPTEAEGRLLKLHTRTFSFQLLEPEGWMLETRAAPQIANFIFHPKGTSWRRAEAVIFARFLPRGPEGTAAELVESKLEDFLEECPFGEENEGALGMEPVNGFEFHYFSCPGLREELFAIAPKGRYFIVFALSGKQVSDQEKAREALRAIVGSFDWVETGPARHNWDSSKGSKN